MIKNKTKEKNKIYIIASVLTIIFIVIVILINYYVTTPRYSTIWGIITQSICSAISGIVAMFVLIQNIKLQDENIEFQKELAEKEKEFRKELAEKEKEFQKELAEKEKEFQLLKRKKELEKSIVEYEKDLNLKIEHISSLIKIFNNSQISGLEKNKLLIEIWDTESFIYWKSLEYSDFVKINELIKLGIMTDFELTFFRLYIKFILSLRDKTFNYKQLENMIKDANQTLKKAFPITSDEVFNNRDEAIQFKEEQYERYKFLETDSNKENFWGNCQRCLINLTRARAINNIFQEVKDND